MAWPDLARTNPDLLARIWLFIFGAWLISVLLAVGIADWNRRSRLGWAAVTLLTGPIGVLILALVVWLGRKPKPAPPVTASGPGSKK
jgi:hypothetical protein